MMASAKAVSTSGFMAVFRAASIAAAGAPASPLLKWKRTGQWRLAANQASTSRAWFCGLSSAAGIQAEL